MFVSVPGFPAPLVRACGRLVGSALLVAVLVACGGDGNGGTGGGGSPGSQVPVDGLAAFRQQGLEWTACDASAMEHPDDQYELAQLGQRAQCALMRVPLDYANPAAAELQIEVLKVVAGQPAQRRGAIVLNPGGPGGEGLSSATALAAKLAAADADTDEARGLLQELARRHDLVAFSPRGTGRHSPLDCTLAQTLPLPTNFNADGSPDNVRDTQRYAQQLAQACAANPLTPHIHTEATARDMDLLRGLLNEDKLNYIGSSYGSWLGAWYAALFPERAGRMLFDSATDITGGFDELMYAQIPATAQLIDESLLPHAIANPGKFGLGTDLAGLRQRLFALPASLKAALARDWDFDEFDSDVYAISAALALNDLLSPDARREEMNAVIDASPRFSHPQVANRARGLVSQRFSPMSVDRHSKEQFVHWSVRCNDTGTTGTEQSWVDRAKAALARYPFSEIDLVGNPCLYWNAAPRKMPAAAQIRSELPVLLLQSEYDPLTPLEGARRTLAALPDARLIVLEKAHEHGLFPYGTACVDSQIARYFLDGTVPAQSISSCAGKALGAENDEDEDDDEDDEEDA